MAQTLIERLTADLEGRQRGWTAARIAGALKVIDADTTYCMCSVGSPGGPVYIQWVQNSATAVETTRKIQAATYAGTLPMSCDWETSEDRYKRLRAEVMKALQIPQVPLPWIRE